MEMFFKIFAGIYGLCIGSFLNVVIHRLPLKESIVYRSKCPSCGSKINWYQNIPLFSYIFLLGKCSKCKKAISLRYPFVELVTGVAAFFLFPEKISFESVVLALFYFGIFCIFLSHLFIDLDHQILPDSLNLILLGLILAYSITFFPLIHWLVGGIIGLALPLGVTWLFYLFRGQIGLGGGDIKLFAILGIFLGPKGVVETIFFSCFLGSIVGLLLIATGRISRERPIAFGPYIIVVAFVQIFFQDFYKAINFFQP